MNELLGAGHYLVEKESSADERKSTSRTTEYRVVKGETANEAETGVLGRQFGFKSSKWYAYEVMKVTVLPQLKFSPTAPQRAHRKHYAEVTFANHEFDRKCDAVNHVQSEMAPSQ